MVDEQITPAVVTIDDKEYVIETLSVQQKELINLYQIFTEDVRTARVKLAQVELARENLASKIVASVKASSEEVPAA